MNKIAILTSGGDAPGMNTAIWAIVKTAHKKGMQTFVVYEGYKGLVEGDIKEITPIEVENWSRRGGTKIYSTRYPEFHKPEVRQVAKEQLEKLDIDTLIVIGGDGSFMGAKLLSDIGVNTIGIPGTIDNDIPTTDLSIGFITAVETVANAIDSIRDTLESHNRTAIVEVMGRNTGALALNSALAAGAEGISIPERTLTETEITDIIKNQRKKGKRSVVIVVTEKLYDVKELAKKVQLETGVETRSNVLGHQQRGGSPAPGERIIAARMGVFAVEQILNGASGVSINVVNSEMKAIDFNVLFETEREYVEGLLNQYDLVK